MRWSVQNCGRQLLRNDGYTVCDSADSYDNTYTDAHTYSNADPDSAQRFEPDNNNVDPPNSDRWNRI
jgi:hypothetical protein